MDLAIERESEGDAPIFAIVFPLEGGIVYQDTSLNFTNPASFTSINRLGFLKDGETTGAGIQISSNDPPGYQLVPAGSSLDTVFLSKIDGAKVVLGKASVSSASQVFAFEVDLGAAAKLPSVSFIPGNHLAVTSRQGQEVGTLIFDEDGQQSRNISYSIPGLGVDFPGASITAQLTVSRDGSRLFVNASESGSGGEINPWRVVHVLAELGAAGAVEWGIRISRTSNVDGFLTVDPLPNGMFLVRETPGTSVPVDQQGTSMLLLDQSGEVRFQKFIQGMTGFGSALVGSGSLFISDGGDPSLTIVEISLTDGAILGQVIVADPDYRDFGSLLSISENHLYFTLGRIVGGVGQRSSVGRIDLNLGDPLYRKPESSGQGDILLPSPDGSILAQKNEGGAVLLSSFDSELKPASVSCFPYLPSSDLTLSPSNLSLTTANRIVVEEINITTTAGPIVSKFDQALTLHPFSITAGPCSAPDAEDLPEPRLRTNEFGSLELAVRTEVGLTYEFQSTADLGSPFETILTTAGDGLVVSFLLPTIDPKAFFRVRLVK